MSKIKVGELRETLKELESKQVGVETIDFHGLSISVQQFLPIQDKINLVASIFDSAIDRSEGLHILDGNKLDIAYKVLVVGEYTNITLPKDTVVSYDMLCGSGLFDVVYNVIPLDERLLLESVLDNYIDVERDEYEQSNTIQYIVKEILQSLINKIPDETELEKIMSNAKEELAKFDPQKLKYVNDFMAMNKGETVG